MTLLLQECSVKDDLIRDLEAERVRPSLTHVTRTLHPPAAVLLTFTLQVVHSSALADLRSSSASLACTMEAVARVLNPIAPGTRPPPALTQPPAHVTSAPC